MSFAGHWWPIWKRAEEKITDYISINYAPFRFRVRICESEDDAADPTEGVVIYEGRASAAPNSNDVIVSINDIAADYLSAPFQLDGRWVTQPRLGAWFAVDAWNETDGGSWDKIVYWYFLMDYSYDRDFNLAAMPLAHPVTGVVAPNQWLVASFVDVADVEKVEFEIFYADGTSETVSVPLTPYADFNNDFNNDFAVEEGETAVSGYAALYLGNYAGAVSVNATCGSITSPTYTIRQDTCKRYVLYYRNAYGGYDSLLLDGAVRSEGYQHNTIGRWADNSVRGQRERHDYRNDVQESWVLRIGGLTDLEAERMPQVVGSTDAYLCDLNTGDLVPLVLTEDACEVKTYRNQGRKRIEYTITAQTAQKREKR